MTGHKSVFWVWRRGDGYVGSTRGSAPPRPDRDGPFQVLLETEDWGEAKAMVEAERDERHRATVAAWE